MSRFVRASYVVWRCQYHVIWVPKYLFRMLQGPVGQEAYKRVMTFCQQLGCEVVELKCAGRSHSPVGERASEIIVIRVDGRHFWIRAYCVDTVGLNSEMISEYVKFQEKEVLCQELLQLESRGAPFSEGLLSAPSGGRKARPRSRKVVVYYACSPGGGANPGIFVATKDAVGNWPVPVGLSVLINPPCIEDRPYVSPGEEGLFSSDRAGGYGGKD